MGTPPSLRNLVMFTSVIIIRDGKLPKWIPGSQLNYKENDKWKKTKLNKIGADEKQHRPAVRCTFYFIVF